MLWFFSCCRNLRVFWRYREQSQSYEALKYYLVLVAINLIMLAFYLGAFQRLIQIQHPIFLTTLVALHISTLVTMMKTHSLDPGYIVAIRKETDFINQVELETPPFNGRIFLGESHQYKVPILGLNQDVKFCETCNIYKPPLTSHCSRCKKCVKEMDHHCPWLNNCIGKNNYKTYYLHLLSSVGLCINVMGLCISLIIRQENIALIVPVILEFALLILAIACGIPLTILLAIHTYFRMIGTSTRIFVKRYRTKKELDSQKDNVTIRQKLIIKIRTLLRKKSSKQVLAQKTPVDVIDDKLKCIGDSNYCSSHFINEQRGIDQFAKSLSQVTASSIPFVR